MDTEKYKNYIGKFKGVYIAHSLDKEIRKKASSGGAVTALLKFVLNNKIVDRVISVGFDKEAPYKYKILKIADSKDLDKTIGSKYVKIPLNEILELVGEKEKTAIVGLPCIIDPLAKLKERGKYKNIILMIGLFCGWGFDSRATDYLIKKAGIKKEDIKSIDYRGGKYPGGFSVETKDNRILRFKKYHYDIVNLLFRPVGCVNCKFYTSEQADISIGDAWLKDKEDWSTIILRTKIGKTIFDKTIEEKYIKAEKIEPELVIRSHWHNIKHKKIGDSLLFRFIIKILNVPLVRYILPFRLLSSLVKIRRKLIKKC